MIDEERIILKEYKSCFGEYCDEEGNICRQGENGFCMCDDECKREYIYY